MAPMINNTWVPQTHRDTSNIQTYGNIISSETFDANNNLTLGKYYAIKEFTNTMEVGEATITGKGYQYTYYTTADEGYANQKIEYYFKVDYSQDTDLRYEDINLYLKGNINPNGYDMYWEEYNLYAQTGTITAIDTFLATTTYTFSNLEALRTTPITQITSSSQTIDTVDTYCNITIPKNILSKPKYIKISYIYEVGEEFTNITPMNMIATTKNIWTTCSGGYTYSYDVQYNYEVVDIPGLLFTILGMPFAWLSTAFNLTIFPGTPYAINISHLMFAVIGALILIVILKKIIK